VETLDVAQTGHTFDLEGDSISCLDPKWIESRFGSEQNPGSISWPWGVLFRSTGILFWITFGAGFLAENALKNKGGKPFQARQDRRGRVKKRPIAKIATRSRHNRRPLRRRRPPSRSWP
jgi:hypothetical protein